MPTSADIAKLPITPPATGAECQWLLKNTFYTDDAKFTPGEFRDRPAGAVVTSRELETLRAEWHPEMLGWPCAPCNNPSLPGLGDNEPPAATFNCTRPKGHEGPHAFGSYRWGEPKPEPAPAVAERLPLHRRVLFLDLETTGTDAEKHQILEWAMVLADEGFEPLATASGTVHLERDVKLDDWITKHHGANGLLSACYSSPFSIEDAEGAMLSTVHQWGLIKEDQKVELAGFTVHFDLGFLKKHTPSFARRLSHRVFDVSTLRTAEKEWGSEPPSPDDAVHRALPDAIEALDCARRIVKKRWGF